MRYPRYRVGKECINMRMAQATILCKILTLVVRTWDRQELGTCRGQMMKQRNRAPRGTIWYRSVLASAALWGHILYRDLSLSHSLSYSVSLFLSHTTTHTHTHTHTPFLSASTPEAWATRAPVHTSNAIPPRQIVSSGERRNDETMGKDMRRTVNILAYKACRPLGAMIPWSSTSFPRFGFTVASQVHTGANAFKIHYEIQPTSTDGADLDCQVVFAAKSCICNEIYCSHPPCVVRGWVSFRFANLHSSCVLILFK
jgi:hypothetical protein